MRTARRGERGLVLAAVLFFVLLMVGAVATFMRRATVDGMIARNRDAAAGAEALARGGVQLAIALLLQDRLDEAETDFRSDTREELWAQVGSVQLRMPDGGELVLRIEDAGARLSLNALFAEGAPRDDKTELLLAALFEKVIGEMPGRPEEKRYDPQELAWNLIDWVDADDLRLRGGPEDAYYQEQRPPYRPANRPLLSLDELALVEGFDRELVEALRPYVDVYPWVGGDGINPNTAPSYVLALLYHGVSGDYRLADEDTVRAVLDIRGQDGILCAIRSDASAAGGEPGAEECVAVGEAVEGEIYPPPTWTTDVFRVRAEAAYGDVRRAVEAVVDRSDVTEPKLLAWSVR